ncbi:MAG: glycosyltransferase family 2 protein [Nitrososphaeria archaeon]
MIYHLVSVIILNYNGLRNLGNILKECIESVLNTDYPNFEVLFVDNASTDGSVDFIKKKFGWDARLKIIQNERNFGFAEGNNIGMKKAKGEYIVLLNNDTKVDSQWLKELVKALQAPEIGAAQSKILQLQNPNLLDCAGGFIDYIGLSYSRGYGEKAEKYQKITEIFYAKGAALIIKRKVLKRIGCLDPIMFLYYEEADLCWRVWLNGYKVIFVPTSIVYHAQGATTSKLFEHSRVYFLTRNRIITLIKNYDLKSLLKNLPSLILLDIRNALVLILRRKWCTSFSIFEAIIWNITHLKYIWKKRSIVQNIIRRVSDDRIHEIMIKPYPPFPHSLILSKSCWLRKKKPK